MRRPQNRAWSRTTNNGEAGIALPMVILAMTLLMALGGGLMMFVVTEVRIAAHYRDGLEAFHAADALVQRIRSELRRASDVSDVLTGDFTSTLVDGAPGGERRIGNTIINLTDITNIELCNRVASCSDSALDAVTAGRPWGSNNPRWRLYSYGWLSTAIGALHDPRVYLVAWVGDDPYESDGDPLRDGAGAGRGRLALRVRAYGAHGARREMDVIVAHVPDDPRLIRWEERR